MAMGNTLISQIYKNTNRYTTILWKYTISVLVQTYSLHKEDEITDSIITLFTVIAVRILMYNDKNCCSQSRKCRDACVGILQFDSHLSH